MSDDWSGRHSGSIFEECSCIGSNHLSREAVLGLKIGGGILAGLAALVGALGGSWITV